MARDGGVDGRPDAPTARFVPPPWLESWRCLCRYATLVQYRDGSAMHWEPGFEVGWWERLEALNCAVYYRERELAEELRARYTELTPGRLVDAAERYHIDFVVMPADWKFAEKVRVVHKNHGYRAYAVGDLREASE